MEVECRCPPEPPSSSVRVQDRTHEQDHESVAAQVQSVEQPGAPRGRRRHGVPRIRTSPTGSVRGRASQRLAAHHSEADHAEAQHEVQPVVSGVERHEVASLSLSMTRP